MTTIHDDPVRDNPPPPTALFTLPAPSILVVSQPHSHTSLYYQRSWS